MIVPRHLPTGDDVAAHYDSLDRFYREVWGEHVHHGLWRTGAENVRAATHQLIAEVATRAAIQPGDAVCDLGCGYGGTARVLASDYRAAVTGLTISAAQHAYASSLEPSAANPVYLLRDWARNELPAASFDAVVAIESTEHVADKAGLFAEVYRVLRPGGRLVVCAWLARSAARTREVRYLLEPICREGRLMGMGTAEEYHALVLEAGLQPIGYEDVSRQVKRTWPICAGRIVKGLIRQPEYRRFLFNSRQRDRIFMLTMFRIWLAYSLGSMRYGILAAVKPGAFGKAATS
jgi:tocopherol O-methyltransferase